MTDLRTIQDILRRLAALERAREFGTFTPTMLGGTTPGTTTYSTQAGYYVRIGNVVLAHGLIVWTNATGTGDAQYSLPLTPSSDSNARYGVAVRTSALTFTATSGLQGLILPGAANFIITGHTTNAAAATLAVEVAGAVDFAAVYRL